jgi:protein-tyrosine-phosphatase
VLCTNSFDLEDVVSIQMWLKKQYDIESHYYQQSANKLDTQASYVIHLNSTNAKKLFEVIGNHVWKIPCMRYKLPKGFFPASKNLEVSDDPQETSKEGSSETIRATQKRDDIVRTALEICRIS